MGHVIMDDMVRRATLAVTTDRSPARRMVRTLAINALIERRDPLMRLHDIPSTVSAASDEGRKKAKIRALFECLCRCKCSTDQEDSIGRSLEREDIRADFATVIPS